MWERGEWVKRYKQNQHINKCICIESCICALGCVTVYVNESSSTTKLKN